MQTLDLDNQEILKHLKNSNALDKSKNYVISGRDAVEVDENTAVRFIASKEDPFNEKKITHLDQADYVLSKTSNQLNFLKESLPPETQASAESKFFIFLCFFFFFYFFLSFCFLFFSKFLFFIFF